MSSLWGTKLRLCCVSFAFAILRGVDAFAWGPNKMTSETTSGGKVYIENTVPISSPSPRLSNIYTITLNELQELESEPLCHRIAARLLVNNCQLLDGQDEATVHMDSGRAARDFIDFYAASLAICDLERGSFVIPTSCDKFRESTLATLSAPSKPQLHVSTPEIDSCLEGLAQSDSAWNTWVSYRHKALRFCEAARVDHEKDQNIHLYQRVTKILEKLTTEVEVELEARLNSLEQVIQDTTQGLESLGPQVDHLKDGLIDLENILSKSLFQSARESAGIIRGGLDEAKSLQHLLTVLVKTVLDKNAEMAASHESALQVITQQVNNDVGAIMATLAAVVVSSSALHQEINASHSRVSEVTRKQEKIEAGMERLEEFAHTISLEHAHHQEAIQEAQGMTTQLLNTLELASSSATTLGVSMSAGLGLSGWWPYIFCPAVSLVMGSYGLPPSAGRNILLIGFGEVASFGISSMHQYIGVSFPVFSTSLADSKSLNSTTAHGVPSHLSDDFITHEDLRGVRFIRQ